MIRRRGAVAGERAVNPTARPPGRCGCAMGSGTSSTTSGQPAGSPTCWSTCTTVTTHHPSLNPPRLQLAAVERVNGRCPNADGRCCDCLSPPFTAVLRCPAVVQMSSQFAGYIYLIGHVVDALCTPVSARGGPRCCCCGPLPFRGQGARARGRTGDGAWDGGRSAESEQRGLLLR